MYNQYIDENNLTFPQELQGQGSIQRKFLQVFREQISNLQKVLSYIQVGMAEQTSNNCICKGPLARFWSNPTTQPMSQLICVVAYGERYEIGGGGSCHCRCRELSPGTSNPLLAWWGGVGSTLTGAGAALSLPALSLERQPRRCSCLLSRGKCRNGGKTLPRQHWSCYSSRKAGLTPMLREGVLSLQCPGRQQSNSLRKVHS